MNILQINGSARSQAGNSTRLANELVGRLVAGQPAARVVVRDLARDPAPAIDEAALGALFTPAEQRSPEQAARVALSDALVAEVQAADVLGKGKLEGVKSQRLGKVVIRSGLQRLHSV